MAATELVEIGYVVKTHGVKGHLRITFKDHVKELSPAEALFFIMKGEKVPFFIKDIEYLTDSDALVLFEDVNSLEDATRFSKKSAWGKQNLFLERNGEPEEINYTGYLVVDEELGELGKVEAFYEMSEYDLLELTYNERNLMIPFHDETIIEIDDNKKVITIKLPDGLLEI